jgi:capsular polysaccharide biosynthesis protein
VELRQYWQVVADRAVVVGVTFVVALVAAFASVYLVPQTSSPYQAAISLAVKPELTPQATPSNYPLDYYSYVTSEYAVDDLISVVESDDFMQALRARLQGRPGGAPSGSVKGVKSHRVVEFTITSSSADGALSLAQAIADTLTSRQSGARYFDMFATEGQDVSVVQPPRIVSQPAGRNALLNLAARGLVGLVAGVGLAFLLEYLDDTIRPEEVEALLGWPILGEIPGRGLPPTASRGGRGRSDEDMRGAASPDGTPTRRPSVKV